MSRDSFGSFSTPLKSTAQSPNRDSFGSFQEYKVESDEALKEVAHVEEVMEDSPVNSKGEVFDLGAELLVFTDKTVFYELTGSDPVQTALKKCFTFEEMVGMNSRTLMSLDEAVKSGKDVLEILISNQSWYAITQYTRNELISCSSNFDQIGHIMKLWNTRFLALYKLNEYDALEHEFKKLGDLNRNSLHYENYAHTGMTGPIVPFQISLMYCRVPLLKQNYTETVERLYELLYSLKHKDKSCEILTHIGNALLKMEDYFLAIQVYKTISESYDDNDPEKLELDSIRGRIYLQLGDLDGASEIFNNVSLSANNTRLVLTNNALLAISKGDWTEASLNFSKILETTPNNWTTCNNLAIIELYKGQITEALLTLDAALNHSPKEMARSPEAIFNLCTVYDLLDQSLEKKKKVLANVISPFSGDDFQIGSLKL